MSSTALVVPRLVAAEPTHGAPGASLVWRFDEPCRSISSAVLGGGLGVAAWVLNVTVDPDYSRLDPVEHLAAIASGLGLVGQGLGLMTAVDVASCCSAEVDGVRADATVGVRRPVYAASDHDAGPHVGPGTINVVAQVPRRLSDAALVNTIATVTEAKVQAMYDTGVHGTGTASDAVCVVCPIDGEPDPFGGPRSSWGAPLARAVHEAVVAGVERQRRS